MFGNDGFHFVSQHFASYVNDHISLSSLFIIANSQMIGLFSCYVSPLRHQRCYVVKVDAVVAVDNVVVKVDPLLLLLRKSNIWDFLA